MLLIQTGGIVTRLYNLPTHSTIGSMCMARLLILLTFLYTRPTRLLFIVSVVRNCLASASGAAAKVQ